MLYYLHQKNTEIDMEIEIKETSTNSSIENYLLKLLGVEHLVATTGIH
jgi:hypothetical protein